MGNNVLKVVIVDDEKIAIEDLISLFDWKGNGYVVEGVYNNGKRAFEAIQKAIPDIVITDVKMPVMNGIELIRAMKQHNIPSKVILVSSYSEFCYVKQAIEMGVSNYLLKDEITPERLKSVLDKVRQELVYRTVMDDLMQEKILQDFFAEKSCPQTWKPNKKINSLFSRNCYLAIIAEKDKPISIERIEPFRPKEQTAVDWLGIIKCLGNEVFPLAHIVQLMPERTLLLFEFTDHCCADSILRIRLEAFARTIVSACQQEYGSSYSAFFINEKSSIQKIKSIYTKHKDNIFSKYFLGTKLVLPLKELPRVNICQRSVMETEVLYDCLKTGDSFRFCKYLDEIFDNIQSEYAYRELEATVRALNYFFEINRLGDLKDGDSNIVNGHGQWRLSAESIKQHFQEQFQQYIANMHTEEEANFSRDTKAAIQYIKKYYGDPSFNIQQMADDLQISLTRLFTTFKQDTGKTVLEYLTDYRIEIAKQLLRQRNYKVYEVAEKVGYGSAQYFSQVFVKKVGINPNDYKRRS